MRINSIPASPSTAPCWPFSRGPSATTNAQHAPEVYLNLASRLTLTGLNQLWVADITYIRLRTELVYLAVVSSRMSRATRLCFTSRPRRRHSSVMRR